MAASQWWDSFKNELSETLGPQDLGWIDGVLCTYIDQNSEPCRLGLAVPSKLHQDVFSKRFSFSIKSQAQKSLGKIVDLDICIDPALAKTEKPAPAAPELIPIPTPKKKPDLNFENFVVGAANEVAHAAALLVANAPAVNANPLFIHGASGLGKSHLLMAILNHRRDLCQKAFYITGEQFLCDFVDHVRANKMSDFRRRIRHQPDMILIDDIHTLGNGSAVQEELFNTLNHYFLERKQVVITSDQKPNELKSFADRIRTRLGGGAIVKINWADFDLRRQFILQKANNLSMTLPDKYLTALASKSDLSIRELEGRLRTINLYKSVLRDKSDEQIITSVIGPVSCEKKSLPELLRQVSDRLSVREKDIISKSRVRKIIRARQAFIYVASKHHFSLTSIGRVITRDHSTVHAALKRFKKILKEDPTLEKQIEAI